MAEVVFIGLARGWVKVLDSKRFLNIFRVYNSHRSHYLPIFLSFPMIEIVNVRDRFRILYTVFVGHLTNLACHFRAISHAFGMPSISRIWQ